MTEVEILKDAIARAWTGEPNATHPVSSARCSGKTYDLLVTVAATAVQEHYAARLERLTHTVRKLASWQGNDISELIDDGWLEEGDLV